MRSNSFRLLSQKAARRLKSIPAAGPPEATSLPLASFIVRGTVPPRVTTDVRPVRTGRTKGWQVTVSGHELDQQLAAPPKFAITRIRATRRYRHRPNVVVNDAFRPKGRAFEPEPRLVRRFGDSVLIHKGQRVMPLTVQGHLDNRSTYRDTSFPWGCVCKIISGPAGGGGSGVLIGPRHVLTASHCVDWAAGWAIVEVHRFDSTFLTGSCCTRLTAFTKLSDVKESTLDEDYAVLTLADRLGDQLGWMGNVTYDSGYDDEPMFRTIGYADDIAKSNRPVYEKDFHLDEDEFDFGDARAMTCGADLMPGQSGSPIFAFGAKDDQPYVVAVVSAEFEGDNYCSGGSWLTKLVREARQLDP